MRRLVPTQSSASLSLCPQHSMHPQKPSIRQSRRLWPRSESMAGFGPRFPPTMRDPAIPSAQASGQVPSSLTSSFSARGATSLTTYSGISIASLSKDSRYRLDGARIRFSPISRPTSFRSLSGTTANISAGAAGSTVETTSRAYRSSGLIAPVYSPGSMDSTRRSPRTRSISASQGGEPRSGSDARGPRLRFYTASTLRGTSDGPLSGRERSGSRDSNSATINSRRLRKRPGVASPNRWRGSGRGPSPGRSTPGSRAPAVGCRPLERLRSRPGPVGSDPPPGLA